MLAAASRRRDPRRAAPPNTRRRCRPLPESGTDRRASPPSAGRSPARGRARRACAPGRDRRRRARCAAPRRYSSARPCARTMPFGPDAGDVGGGQHPLHRAHRQAVEREREARIAASPSAAASAPPPCAARGCRAGASARRTAARAAAPRPCRRRCRRAPRGRSRAYARRASRSWTRYLPRSSASETPARARDLGEADVLEPLLGQQRHEGARRSRSRWRAGWIAAGCADGSVMTRLL